ncbi:MAG: hypothetical protein ACRDL3_03485 [Solirubrobacterales bacterium]
MRSPRPLFLSLSLLVACALALAACGGDEEGTIPPESAAALLQSLDDARGERDQEDCQGIEDAAGNLRAQVEQLPDTVDAEVRTALEEGTDNLVGLADDPEECESAGTTGPSDQQTETTDTTTEFTEPTTPETTTEEEKEPPPEQPENEGGGENFGQGNQGGQPGGPNGGGPPESPPGQGEPPTGGTEGDD